MRLHLLHLRPIHTWTGPPVPAQSKPLFLSGVNSNVLQAAETDEGLLRDILTHVEQHVSAQAKAPAIHTSSIRDDEAKGKKIDIDAESDDSLEYIDILPSPNGRPHSASHSSSDDVDFEEVQVDPSMLTTTAVRVSNEQSTSITPPKLQPRFSAAAMPVIRTSPSSEPLPATGSVPMLRRTYSIPTRARATSSGKSMQGPKKEQL